MPLRRQQAWMRHIDEKSAIAEAQGADDRPEFSVTLGKQTLGNSLKLWMSECLTGIGRPDKAEH